jgi:hypothetical protein
MANVCSKETLPYIRWRFQYFAPSWR